MDIIKYLKDKYITKSKETSLTTSDKGQLQTNTIRKKKIKNLVDFIENSLIANGGNYEDIHSKLLAISEFAKSAKDLGVDCDLSRIDETLQDFFTPQKDIKFTPFKDIPYRAFYFKKDGWSFYNHRGVTVVQDEKAQKPVLYYGRRHAKAERHAKDTILCFGDDTIIFRNEYSAHYDEIPLWTGGTHAEFTFDQDNNISKVTWRKITNSRLKFWSKPQTCKFDNFTSTYKLLPQKI